MTVITINGNTLDPAQPTALSFGPQASDATDTNYIVLQTNSEVLQDADYAQLGQLGVKLLQIVSDQTYICGYEGTDLKAIRELPCAAYVDTYKENFVIAPSLKTGTTFLAMQTPPGLPTGSGDGLTDTEGLSQVDILLHQDASGSEEAVKDEIARRAGVDTAMVTMLDNHLRVTLPHATLSEVAKIDKVQAILPVHKVKTFNDKAREILHSDVNINGTAYKGEGQIVCVADTGFDLGNADDVPVPFEGRVIKLYPLGRGSGPNALTDDPGGHGTHVCGSAVGDGTYLDQDGSEIRMEAAASRARLIVQSLITPDGEGLSPGPLSSLLATAYADGARVHTNSWGASQPSIPYDGSVSPRELDDFVFNNRDLVVCFAAGNDGVDRNGNPGPDGIVDLGQLGSEATAKNIITVGASESERMNVSWTRKHWGDLGSRFPRAPLRDDHIANSREDMAAFSSRGPALPHRGERKHRRTKPDVVAPGTAILSTKSRHEAVRHPTQPAPQWGPSPHPDWMWDFGTSMACPLVAGCCAVIREFLVKNGHPSPSAALVKAILINGAVALESEPTTPNFASGFGRVNLHNSIVPSGVAEVAAASGFHEGEPLKTGQEHVMHVEIPANFASTTVDVTPTLKVTLVWTDPPGPILVNDLDLIVRAGVDERHGNVDDDHRAEYDRVNNVEQVTWENPPAGPVEIVVRAHNVPRIRGNMTQDYALVWKLFA